MREAHLSRAAAGATRVAPRAAWCRTRKCAKRICRLVQKRAPDESAAGAASSGLHGVWPCAVRLSRLPGQPLSPPRIFGRRAAQKPWGCSSVGRAPALQAGGHRFDSVHLHHRPNDAQRRSCRARQAQRELRRERLVQKRAPVARASRAGVLSCTMRLSRLPGQPLTPPDMNDATRRSVDDREKQRFASSLSARGKVF